METCVQEVVDSNPSTGHYMDIFTFICGKIGIVCLKRLKINKKETGMVHFLKQCFGAILKRGKMINQKFN